MAYLAKILRRDGSRALTLPAPFVTWLREQGYSDEVVDMQMRDGEIVIRPWRRPADNLAEKVG